AQLIWFARHWPPQREAWERVVGVSMRVATIGGRLVERERCACPDRRRQIRLAMNILPKAAVSARRRSIVVAPVLVCTRPLFRQNGHERTPGEISTDGLRSVFRALVCCTTSGPLTLRCAVIGMLRFYRA